jgi:dipeptidyl aminopeptidase/acylaminoacyl peptidase
MDSLIKGLTLSLLITPLVSLRAAEVNEVPGPSFEQVISLRSSGNPEISPDGRTVVFTVSSTDWKENRYDTEIWIKKEGQKPFQLTRTAEGSSVSPKWSPDGKWIAFLADRGNKQQVFLIRPDGGEAQPITDFKAGIRSFEWAPDGATIAFNATEEETSADKDRKKRYGEYSVEDEEYRQSHLWLVKVTPDLWPSASEVTCSASEDGETPKAGEEKPGQAKNGSDSEEAACPGLPKPRRLTQGDDFTVSDFSWAPDGTRIAFGHRANPLINSWPTSDISILDIESGAVTPLVERPGADSGATWSPDSRWILFESDEGNTNSNYYVNNRIFKIPSSGGDPVRLAPDFDENIGTLHWAPTGIFFVSWQRTQRHLFRLDPESGEIVSILPEPAAVFSVSFSKDGDRMALSGTNPNTLPEIYRSTVSSPAPESVTRMSEQIGDWTTGSSEVVSWVSRDGARIEGVLHKPDDFDPTRKYPLLVVIHGGPTGIDFPSIPTGYVYPIMQWLSKGALVLRPNYRGSAGYGEEFRALNVRNLGVGDAWDVLSGVDYLIDQGVVDESRMGAMGWSQGGYISAFLTTNTDRFKAISVGAGISDWMTYYVNTDIHPFTRQYLKATPWDDPQIYAVTSPITNIRKARTPTLIQHGELDRRVPIANAYELYQGLQDVGTPTELIVYKGFGHGISKPKERLAATWHNWKWFAKYLWDEEIVIPVKGD